MTKESPSTIKAPAPCYLLYRNSHLQQSEKHFSQVIPEIFPWPSPIVNYPFIRLEVEELGDYNKCKSELNR